MPPVIDATCPDCGWFGTTTDCESDENGTLVCPACGAAVLVSEEES